MTIENIRSLLEIKTSEEIAKEFSDNLNKAIQMKKDEEAKKREENERLKQRLLILEDMMALIDDYFYLSDYKYPNEEEVDLREVDKMIQDFLAMTETIENNGWLSFFSWDPTLGFSVKDTEISTDPTLGLETKNTDPLIKDTTDPSIDSITNTTWEELINSLFSPYIEK